MIFYYLVFNIREFIIYIFFFFNGEYYSIRFSEQSTISCPAEVTDEDTLTEHCHLVCGPGRQAEPTVNDKVASETPNPARTRTKQYRAARNLCHLWKIS